MSDAAGADPLALDTTVSAVRDRGVEWLVCESESSPDTYDALDSAASLLRRYW